MAAVQLGDMELNMVTRNPMAMAHSKCVMCGGTMQDAHHCCFTILHAALNTVQGLPRQGGAKNTRVK
jgi:hypothetical protein